MKNNFTEAQKKLIGALVGLARSLDESNSGFSALDTMLAALRPLNTADEGELLRLYEEVRAEKQRAVPDCSVCQNPCGRTFDFDMNELANLPGELAELKCEIIAALVQLAAGTSCGENDFEVTLATVRDALFAVGYEWFSADDLLALVRRVKEA